WDSSVDHPKGNLPAFYSFYYNAIQSRACRGGTRRSPSNPRMSMWLSISGLKSLVLLFMLDPTLLFPLMKVDERGIIVCHFHQRLGDVIPYGVSLAHRKGGIQVVDTV